MRSGRVGIEACGEACLRPTMRFVPLEPEEHSRQRSRCTAIVRSWVGDSTELIN